MKCKYSVVNKQKTLHSCKTDMCDEISSVFIANNISQMYSGMITLKCIDSIRKTNLKISTISENSKIHME